MGIFSENCIDDIRSWMEHDKLLNDEKSEFLVIGTGQQLSKVNVSSITVGNSAIRKSSVVRNHCSLSSTLMSSCQ